MSYKSSVKIGVLLTVAVALSITASSAYAQTTQPQLPESRPEEKPQAKEPLTGKNLTEQIARVTENLLDVAREDPDKAGKVADALLELDMAYYQTLLDHAQDEDPEVRARILSIIRTDIIDTRIRRVLALLTKEDGEKLCKFQESKPQLFREFFSPELSDRIRAAKAVGDMKDPQCLAEPLLAMCIKHPAKELSRVAIESASKGIYKSETLVDALIYVIKMHGIDSDNYYYDKDDSLPSGMAALDALQAIPTPYVSAGLFNMTFSGQGGNMDEDLPLAEALATTGDKNLIPHLIKELKNTATRGSRSTGELQASYARSDAALLVLLRITAQSIDEYKFVYFRQYNYCIFGFAKEADRKQAIEKFEKWWEENKSEPAYKDIKPLDLSSKSKRQTSRPASPTTRPARRKVAIKEAPSAQEPKPATQPATQPTTPPTATMPDIESLKADISAETQRLIKIFHSTNFRTRENAQASLLAIKATRDHVLSANIDNENGAVCKLVIDIMANSMAEARITQVLIELDESDRKKLLEFRTEHNDVFRDAMSLTWEKNQAAVITIGADNLVKAEPLLLMMLKHPHKSVVMASIRAAVDAPCKSDAMIDALCKIVADALPVNSNRGFSPYQFFDQDNESGAALGAIKDLKSPRCLPHILAFMKNNYVQYNTQARFEFADVIASIEDISVIPELMKELDNSRSLGRWSSGKDSISMSSSDPILKALIKLTKQKDLAYNLIKWKQSYNNTKVYGFKKDEERTQAIAKFKEWWAKNKSLAPYKDIKPITPLE